MDADLRSVLAASGWHEGRNENVVLVRQRLESVGFQIVDPWSRFCRRFLGLVLGDEGIGVTAARCQLTIDPLLALGERDRFEYVSETLGVSVSPVGEVADGAAFLAIGSDDGLYYFDVDIWRAGRDWESGLSKLLLGHQAEILVGGAFRDEW